MGLSYNLNAEGLLHVYGFNHNPQNKCSKSTIKIQDYYAEYFES